MSPTDDLLHFQMFSFSNSLIQVYYAFRKKVVMIDNSAATFVRMTFVLKADIPECCCVLTAIA